MGTVATNRIITAPWTLENHENPGQFGLVSRDPSQTIRVVMNGPGVSEVIEIVGVGDSCSFSLLGITQVIVEADSYPTQALINATTAAIELDCAPFVTLVPGSTLFAAHFDATVAGAATTTIWTPTAGKRFNLSEWSVSTDVPNRVALVDGSDVAGSRIAAPYLAASGGQAGGAYMSAAVDNVLKLVTLPGGNVFVSVVGFESD